ncbi:hypothetical protein MKX03_009043 [Papaver bracteatum]|nr:hypothetical protein MKX03_009043 [Papaver bracteatum]
MAEQACTVASDSETTGKDKPTSVYPELAIGIDIGTSQCSIALWNGPEVQLLKNSRNQKMMRSYVTFRDDIPSGGESAHLSHEDEMLSGSAVFNMKRLIGRADTDPVVHLSKTLPFLTLNIGVRPFIAALVNNIWRSTTPEEVLAVFLVELRAMAELQLKRVVRNVVLTIPVSFSRFQLTRIERACAMAGLHVLRLMPEPTSVALLYAQQQQQLIHDNMGSGSEKLALIFNMGAGYCDVCVTATAGGVSQIKALSGTVVGGEDILQNVMRHLLPNLDNLLSSHGLSEIKSMVLLRIATQDAIHRLSSQDGVRVEVDLKNGININRILTRAEFEEINQEVFGKCENLISDVILVGGCSYIPKIRSLVLGLCNKEEPYLGMNPLEAAVCGAALEGAVASGVNDSLGALDLLTIQATPLSLSIRADGSNFVPIIHRNTTMPARKELIFTTAHENQTEALIALVGIPPAPKGSPEISICMDIDASNVLRVFAGILMPGVGRPVHPFLEVKLPTVDDGHGWCTEALM